MKKVLFFISMVLLMPNAALAEAPAANASASKWSRWFKSLRRPTRQDVLAAQKYVKSQWGCLTGKKKCSRRKKYALRSLSAAIGVGLGVGVRAMIGFDGGKGDGSAGGADLADITSAVNDARRVAGVIRANVGKSNTDEFNRKAAIALRSIGTVVSGFGASQKFREVKDSLDDLAQALEAVAFYQVDCGDKAAAGSNAQGKQTSAYQKLLAFTAALKVAWGESAPEYAVLNSLLFVLFRFNSDAYWDNLADALDAMAQQAR